MYRFYLLGLVHLPTTRKYNSCAFTQKNIKLAKMLTSLGHEVYLYGARSTEERPIEDYITSDKLHFIETHSVQDIRKDYGDGDNRFELGYDWTKGDYRHDLNDIKKASTLKFYSNAITHINKIKKSDDFLLCTQGNYHKPIADAVGLFLTVESGIGYRGSTQGWYRAFESSYIQNFTYGSEKPFASVNGSFYDRVIPNYFDQNEFEFKDKKEDYYLFMARVIERKGILEAVATCNAIGKKLIIAGQGAYVDERGHLIDNEPSEFDIPPGTWEYIGFADVKKRKELLANAIALFSPTEYLECFAGVHIEAMLSGTPPITTNFGVYPETIPDYLDGKVGFRCNTLQDFVNAANKSKSVNHKFIREYAERFLMGNVANDYQRWFNDLYAVYESTISDKKGWSRII